MRRYILAGVVVFAVMGLFAPQAKAVFNCDKPNADLQDEIDNAVGPTEIRFKGICSGVEIRTDDITLDGRQGPGPQLGGVGTISGTVSIVGARRIVLENLTIEGSGHGVEASENATATLDHVIVDSNAESGVVLNSGAVATIRNSEITNNLGADLAGVDVNANGLVLLENTLIEDNGTGDPCQLEVTRGRAVLVEGNTIRTSIGETICVLDLGSLNAFSGGADEIIEHTSGGVAVDLSRQSLGNLRGVDVTGNVAVNENSMLEARGVSVDGLVSLSRPGNAEFRSGSELIGIGNLDVQHNGFAELRNFPIAGDLFVETGAVVNTIGSTAVTGAIVCDATGLVTGTLFCP